MQEMAFIAYHFHWPLDGLLDFDHTERRDWVRQISAINRQRNEEPVS